ncbi:MAG: cysteine--tRNA ligase [Candidatus Omnitrophota bacterium]|nr:cysteine--tRNA ligase [Candidatus Omnitrophota bacterium]
MTPQFFNTLSGRIEAFEPLNGKEVRMYTCGPTVYDYAHIGNFRTFIFEDLLRRYLESQEFRVLHTMNITDVDDKTIAGAAREGVALEEYTRRFTDAFCEDLNTLNIRRPNHPESEPRATADIPVMIELIQKLVETGHAYESDCSVYFRVNSFPNYGKLSKKRLEKNITGARVDSDEYEKEDGSDFVLWKAAKEGEPSWESPWGKGRPGWHIECSAMSMKYLGATFDIHAGGEDLVFPHHENEIAQSEAATTKPFVRYWLHSKHLLVDGKKMSKSEGNFYTLRDLLGRGYDPMAIRYALLATHYRMPLNFTLEGLDAARNALKDLKAFYSSVINHEVFGRRYSAEDQLMSNAQDLEKDFFGALADDLNISKALASLFTFVGETDTRIKSGALSEQDHSEISRVLKRCNQVLGVVPEERYGDFPEDIRQWHEERKCARIEKRFSSADKCRQKLSELGYIVWDEADGISGIAK